MSFLYSVSFHYTEVMERILTDVGVQGLQPVYPLYSLAVSSEL